ncbi:MAG TPA: methyltransferase domain-containing protein [Candidatus Omnitrophota bacterium]|nr:methyltransferase domain-containing protein [Candidatus Omnitrophota bacterium]
MERSEMKVFKKYLEEYLKLFWLRPESAIWRAYDAVAIEKIDWMKPPSADLCCADGINSFIMCSGRFGIGFDSFLSVRDVSIEDFLSGKKDIYDFAFKKGQKVHITNRPKYTFDYGLDWKHNSLAKAARLGLYRRLICADANRPLPVKDNSLGSVFSNSIYWMDNVSSVMRDLHRILRDDGKCVALMPDISIKRHYIYSKYLEHGWKFCKVLNMDRYRRIVNCHTYEEWKEIFANAGFEIESHSHYLSGRFIELSEAGLRPLSKVLIKMANSLGEPKRAEIKREWIETLMRIIVPMAEDGFLCDKGSDQTFFAFELRKK